MALRDKWKESGKNIGKAFSNFGKAVATTAKVAVGKEDNTVNEDGKSKLRESWSKTGHGFGDAGKSLGKAAKGTVDKVAGEEKEEKVHKPDESEVRDVNSKMKDEK